MKHSQMKKPGCVGKRKPGQQYNFGRRIAQPNYSKLVGAGKTYSKTNIPAPADFYSAEIEGFKEKSNGWAHGCCPFHDDHNPSFAMNLDSGGYKCLSSNCGASGGSIVSFVCALRGFSRSEALRYLEGLA